MSLVTTTDQASAQVEGREILEDERTRESKLKA